MLGRRYVLLIAFFDGLIGGELEKLHHQNVLIVRPTALVKQTSQRVDHGYTRTHARKYRLKTVI